MWDALAAGYLLDPGFVTRSESHQLDVVTEWGRFYGFTIPLDAHLATGIPPVTVALDLDFKRVFALYRDKLDQGRVNKIIYLGLGSNIGDRERNLQSALEGMEAPDLRVVRVSPVYETEPVDYTQQPWFLNQVAEARTDLFPMQLLARIGRVERRLGRVRRIPKGPRAIDIDILFFGRAIVRAAKLKIPHTRIGARRFVLVPLAVLAPDLRHPVTGKTVREMLDEAPIQKVRRFAGEDPSRAG